MGKLGDIDARMQAEAFDLAVKRLLDAVRDEETVRSLLRRLVTNGDTPRDHFQLGQQVLLHCVAKRQRAMTLLSELAGDGWLRAEAADTLPPPPVEFDPEDSDENLGR